MSDLQNLDKRRNRILELAELQADAEAVLANSDNHWWQRSVPNGGYDKACRLARAVLAAQPAEPSWLTDLRELRSALAAVIAASPAYRRPIGAEHSLARLIQGEQIAAEDAARTILARTEIYDAAR